MTQRAIVPRTIINLQDFRTRGARQFALRIKNYLLTFCSSQICKNRAINFY